MTHSFSDSGFACCRAIACPCAHNSRTVDDLSDTLLYPNYNDLTHQNPITYTISNGLEGTLAISTSDSPA